MNSHRDWSFYGRRPELEQLQRILERRRWFFLQISGRRRIGKTTLIQQALQAAKVSKTLYIQIPDSDPTGVVATCNGYLETFGIAARVTTLSGFAQLIGKLVEEGTVVALDEFQYFHRKHLFDCCSFLQAEVDRLATMGGSVTGGLIVLGSIHAEMTALLEDRNAPLFNRTTDTLELGHLDIASVLEILRTHADASPERLLFLWNLFEGVPKFYRDAYEQGVLDASREAVLERLFFQSSSPLRNEADNWFLRELRGRYDMVLQYLASHSGCSHADILAAMNELSHADESKQVGGYLRVLSERYRMIERRLPIFAKPKMRNGRYYIRDNFLRAWLSALKQPSTAVAFRPLPGLLRQADERLMDLEGHALEDLVAHIYQERSRLGLGDFELNHRVHGYWDRADVEIDLIAVNEQGRRIRFASCKRQAERLAGSISGLRSSAQSFLAAHPRYADWKIEFAAIAPRMTAANRQTLVDMDVLPQDLIELTQGL